MVGVLDPDPERLQRVDGVAAQVGAGIERREVEIAALVEDLGDAALTELVGAEVEELQLRADVEVLEPHFLGTLQRPAHHVARVALVGLAARPEHVAEQARDVALVIVGAPRKQRIGVGVGHRDHVGLLDRVEPCDRRAVEAHALLERSLHLLASDREALELAQDVREPESDELDAVLLDPRQHVAGAALRVVRSGVAIRWWYLLVAKS